jgi:hypothetical protein
VIMVLFVKSVELDEKFEIWSKAESLRGSSTYWKSGISGINYPTWGNWKKLER